MSNHPHETGVDVDEPVDDQYKKIVTQIDDEERLWALYRELREYTEGAYIPLLQTLNMENLSDFLTPSRVRVF